MLDTLFFSLVDNIENQKALFKQIYKAGINVITLIEKMQVELAEKAAFIGYECKVQRMIDDIFVKRQMNDYKGEDMKALR